MCDFNTHSCRDISDLKLAMPLVWGLCLFSKSSTAFRLALAAPAQAQLRDWQCKGRVEMEGTCMVTSLSVEGHERRQHFVEVPFL